MDFDVIPRHAVSQKCFDGILFVTWSDGKVSTYDAVELGCEWFKMSNDAFYKLYGFNFNPHEFSGLYEHCRNLVYPKKKTKIHIGPQIKLT